LPNTSEPPTVDFGRWRERQRQLIASLAEHPLLVVLRPTSSDWSSQRVEQAPISGLIDQLSKAGVRHIEIAWSGHPRWTDLVDSLLERYPGVNFGAASVLDAGGLDCVSDLGMAYAMSPCLDPSLISRARSHGLVLVPGVFSPSEVRQAATLGCEIVKLFPAGSLGVDYLRQLSVPLAPLPRMIAAGGLTAADLDPWLAAGYHALALGRGVISGCKLDHDLLKWLA
jgi:2-dehydro-3-deoxyphosphogluconate aldolase/(4S)-4-hydroxy-2-oxoglutarate aldolase